MKGVARNGGKAKGFGELFARPVGESVVLDEKNGGGGLVRRTTGPGIRSVHGDVLRVLIVFSYLISAQPKLVSFIAKAVVTATKNMTSATLHRGSVYPTIDTLR